jgi:hypothetical protein
MIMYLQRPTINLSVSVSYNVAHGVHPTKINILNLEVQGTKRFSLGVSARPGKDQLYPLCVRTKEELTHVKILPHHPLFARQRNTCERYVISIPALLSTGLNVADFPILNVPARTYTSSHHACWISRTTNPATSDYPR